MNKSKVHALAQQDAAQGDNEKRSEPYLNTVKRASQYVNTVMRLQEARRNCLWQLTGVSGE